MTYYSVRRQPSIHCAGPALTTAASLRQRSASRRVPGSELTTSALDGGPGCTPLRMPPQTVDVRHGAILPMVCSRRVPHNLVPWKLKIILRHPDEG